MPRLVMALDGGREREISLVCPAGGAEPAMAAPSEAERRASELFRELRAPVCRYVMSLGVSPQDADEIVQETFLRLYRHLEQRGSQEHDNLRGWVFRVAQNLAHDQRRRAQAQPRATDRLEDSAEAQRAVDTRVGPEQRLLRAERFARLHVAMQALPPAQQQCLRLRAEGLRYREIAEALDVGVSTVADWIHQALTRLGKDCR
jgi:RNA polymerase sigma-70 factor (ECF subfamily)